MSADRLTLDPVTSSPGAARHWIVTQLGGYPEDLVETAALLASELVTNSILHAQTQVEVRVERGEHRVRVEVADHSTTMPSRRGYGEYATTGHGLALVEALSAGWGAEPAPSGKIVFFDLVVDGSDAATAFAEIDLDAWPDLEEIAAPQSTADVAMVDVVLLGVPLDLLRHASEQYDALAREFSLILDQSPEQRQALPGRLLALMEDLDGRFGSFSDTANDRLQAALERGDESIDLAYRMPIDVGPATLRYDALLDEADAYCRAGALLTLAADPGAVAVRKWFLLEFVGQAGGQPATPWEASAWALSLKEGPPLKR